MKENARLNKAGYVTNSNDVPSLNDQHSFSMLTKV